MTMPTLASITKYSLAWAFNESTCIAILRMYATLPCRISRILSSDVKATILTLATAHLDHSRNAICPDRGVYHKAPNAYSVAVPKA